MLKIVFVCYFVLLMLRPHEFLPQLQQVPLLQYVLLTGMLVWLFRADKGLAQPQFKLLVPFLIVVWIGMGLNGWWGGIVKAVDQLLPPIFFFILASGAVRSLRQLHFFMVLLLACACVLVLHGYYQLQTGVGWTGSLPIEGRITYSGIFNDPNDLGLVFVMSLAICLYLVGLVQSFLIRLAVFAAFGWVGYGVLLTNSRGTMLGSLVVIGYFVHRRYGRTGLMISAVAAIPVLLATTRLAQLDSDDESAEGRLDAWYEGIQLLISHPVFGVGYSNFSDYNRLTAHNSLVLAMAELGLVGYAIWLAFVALSGYMLYWLGFRCESWLKSQGRELTPAIATELAASRALAVAALGFATGAFFLSQSYKYMLFLTCGLAVGRYLGVSQVVGPLPKLGFFSHFPRLMALVFGSILGLYVLVRLAL